MPSLRDRQAVFAEMVAKLIIKSNLIGTPVIVLEWYRDIERQKYLVSIGRSRTLNSKHIEGLAVDLCFIDDLRDDGQMNWTADKYRHLGIYWESLDNKNRWGGSFGVTPQDKEQGKFGWDAPHFEHNG